MRSILNADAEVSLAYVPERDSHCADQRNAILMMAHQVKVCYRIVLEIVIRVIVWVEVFEIRHVGKRYPRMPICSQ